MIVNLNGDFWFDTNDHSDYFSDDFVIVKRSNKLRAFAFTLWTTSGLLFSQTVHADTFYESMQPLTHTFQDIALGLGILFALTGFILLGFRRRWGEATLKTTALIVGGVFLVPSLLMLIAIVGTMLNEALTDAFQNVRDVMGE